MYIEKYLKYKKKYFSGRSAQSAQNRAQEEAKFDRAQEKAEFENNAPEDYYYEDIPTTYIPDTSDPSIQNCSDQDNTVCVVGEYTYYFIQDTKVFHNILQRIINNTHDNFKISLNDPLKKRTITTDFKKKTSSFFSLDKTIKWEYKVKGEITEINIDGIQELILYYYDKHKEYNIWVGLPRKK